ncbi:DUF3488 domain-containing protein [Candidatus Synchoanobacter obligatus]|uniref:HAD family hydrolase n=1 Tax=Candidatus Synchoanobacter obligatus TaxID=2919597 RepID=A0ABT1L5N0_9GAMM|nr:hypothetical protein [Candidatus Synchoanobacter obligatus]MCP8352035.1 hypothetical protein [Candidatus Synchoanobacter obligatus]
MKKLIHGVRPKKSNHGHSHDFAPCCAAHAKSGNHQKIHEDKASGFSHVTGHYEEVAIAIDDGHDYPAGDIKPITKSFSVEWRDALVLAMLALFVIGAGLEFMAIVPASMVWYLNMTVLIVMVQPHFFQLSREANIALAGMLSAVIMAVAPLSGMLLAAAALPVFSLSFHYLLRGGDVKDSVHEFLSITAWQAGVLVLSYMVSPVFFIAASVPSVYGLFKVSNPSIDCNFSLTFVIVLTMTLAIASSMMGLGHIVCLHDAVLAATVVFFKDFGLDRLQKRHYFFVHDGQSEIKLENDVEILSSSALGIGLDKLDEADRKREIGAQRLKLTEEYQGHEVSLGLSCFPSNVLPKNVTIHKGGWFIAKEKTNVAKKERNELDRVAMYLVPSAIVATIVLAVGVGFYASNVTVACALAVHTLLAACPCIFLILPYFQYRLSRHYLTKKQDVSFNFSSKILSSFAWPNFGAFEYLFDRSRTLYFRKAEDGPDAPYQMNGVAESYLKRMMNHVVGFISGSAAKFEGSFRADLKKIGFDSVLVLADQSYTKCCRKLKVFREKQFNSKSIVYFGDGNNDKKIMAQPNVLGIGVDPSPELQNVLTGWFKNWAQFDAEGMNEFVHTTHSAQSFSRILLVQALLVTVAAVLFPSGYFMMYGAMPAMWASCALMVSGFGVMVLEVEAFCAYPKVVSSISTAVSNGLKQFSFESTSSHHCCSAVRKKQEEKPDLPAPSYLSGCGCHI